MSSVSSVKCSLPLKTQDLSLQNEEGRKAFVTREEKLLQNVFEQNALDLGCVNSILREWIIKPAVDSGTITRGMDEVIKAQWTSKDEVDCLVMFLKGFVVGSNTPRNPISEEKLQTIKSNLEEWGKQAVARMA